MNALIQRAVLAAILVCSIPLTLAEQPSAPAPGPGKSSATGQHPAGPPCGGPPPEAYQACAGKSAGSRAEFVSPHGDTVPGICEQEGNGKIVLRPDRPPGEAPGGHRGPPPEAYAACAGKAAGARAQFASPRGDTVTGTCESEGDKTVLRPDRPPK